MREKKFHLSERMSMVAGMVPQGVVLCDVGCDHGFVSIELVREKVCPRVIASDVRPGPLARAKEHVEQAGLSDQIALRLADGLSGLEAGEADCFLAAGMGGRVMIRFLTERLELVRTMRCFILQPQSELQAVRAFLRQQGFVLQAEDMVYEEGKYYTAMRAGAAVPGGQPETGCTEPERGCIEPAGVQEPYTRFLNCVQAEMGVREAAGISAGADHQAEAVSLADQFGPLLILQNHPVLASWLDWKEAEQRSILQQVAELPQQKKRVERELDRIGLVRRLMASENPV